MIEAKDIVIEENNTADIYNHGWVGKSVKIFGRDFFKEGNLGLMVSKELNIESLPLALNDYLAFLSNCKELLMDCYREKNSEIINDCFDGEMTADWYETLEIYGGGIEFDDKGTPSGHFSCGDNMVTDHLLMIEFEHKEINQMYFEG